MGSLRRASPLLLALVVAGLVVLGTRRGQPAASLLASRRPPTAAATAAAATTNKAYLFKRTFASSGAAADAAFARHFLGLELAANGSYADADGPCATREVLSSLGAWELHYFQSRRTPEGNRTVAFWNARVAELLEAGLASDFSGNVVTYFAPRLDPFLARFDEGGVAYRAATAADPSGAPYHALFAAAPHAGHLVAVVSGNATGTFEPLRGCGLALRRNVSDLAATWARLGGDLENARGLPDLLAVGTSVAATAIDPFVAFLEDATLGGASLGAEETAGDGCAVAALALPFSGKASALAGGESYEYDLDVAIASRRGGDGALAALEGDVQRAHERFTGENKGWDRWLDSHLGVQLPATALDAVAARLAAAGRPYKAHLNSAASAAGSLWSGGPAASSVGVEFKGTFDFSYFDDGDLTTLDYCAENSDGATTVSQSGRAGRR